MIRLDDISFLQFIDKFSDGCFIFTSDDITQNC